jgi:hypothetical protein
LEVFADLSSIVIEGTVLSSGRMLRCCSDNVGNGGALAGYSAFVLSDLLNTLHDF